MASPSRVCISTLDAAPHPPRMKTSRRREARKLADYPVVSISETMFFLGKLNAYYSVIKKMDSISYVYIT